MNIIEELQKLKKYHYQCEYRWYSCPLSDEETSNEHVNQKISICGVEKHNNKIDEIIKEFTRE